MLLGLFRHTRPCALGRSRQRLWRRRPRGEEKVEYARKRSTYVTRGQWQTTTRYYRHLKGGGFGELVAHEAEKRETIIHSCCCPVSHRSCVIWRYL
ncbi:hypothetical protein LB503_001922 [Fusarium chuoi]|nr:hypothetical protein LB503_001922 [Fusarium chuoi]